MLLNEESRYDCHGVLFGVRLADRFMLFMPQHQLLRRNLMSKKHKRTLSHLCRDFTSHQGTSLTIPHLCKKKQLRIGNKESNPYCAALAARIQRSVASNNRSYLVAIPCVQSVPWLKFLRTKRNYLVASVRLASTFQ